MKKLQFIILISIVLIGCKEEAVKFVFDHAQTSSQFDYYYKYENGKKVKETVQSYTFLFGQKQDELKSEIHYHYNKKGLLIEEHFVNENDERPGITFYKYDKNDTLIAEFALNEKEDTIRWYKYQMFPDGKKLVFHKEIAPKWNPDFKSSYPKVKPLIMDTTEKSIRYIYTKAQCSTEKHYDKNHDLVKTISFEYEDGKLRKEIHHTYYNSMKLLDVEKVYDYSKSEKWPDCYSFDPQGDTKAFCIYEFKNHEKIASFHSFEYGQVANKFIYRNNRQIEDVGIDNELKIRVVTSIEYYKNGDLKTMKSYNEKLKPLY